MKEANRILKLNNKAREQWILNHEGLYNWFKSERKSMSTFIRENRAEIDKVIRERFTKPPKLGGSL